LNWKKSIAACLVLAFALGSTGAMAQYADSTGPNRLRGKPGTELSSSTSSSGISGGWSQYFTGETKCIRAPRYYFDTCATIQSDGSIVAWDMWHPTKAVVASGTSGYGGVVFWAVNCWEDAWDFIAYPSSSTEDQTFGRVPTSWVLAPHAWINGGGCG